MLLVAPITCVLALNNGLGLKPQMGYSSWNDCGSYVSEAHVKNITRFMIDKGLIHKGYRYINVDEGWMKGRNATTGNFYEDVSLFPSGMKGLGDWIKSQDVPGLGKVLKYGLYTSRGTCQCSSGEYDKRCIPTTRSKPHPEGSNGHEKQDVDWIVAQGADYIKVDSCCGNQDHATAFSDYAKFRDALNATGKPVFFSLCGWHDWYSQPDPALHYTGGYSLGNSWRIHGDGSSWKNLCGCANTMSYLQGNAGPGGWNDPDLLIGPNTKVGGQTDIQARSQFSLWCVMAAPLLISNNLLAASAHFLETVSNDHAIAVNQDAAGIPGTRIAGGDLSFPCAGKGSTPGALFTVEMAPCSGGSGSDGDGSGPDPAQQWTYTDDGYLSLASAGTSVLDVYNCGTKNKSPVTVFAKHSEPSKAECSGKNQRWSLAPVKNSSSWRIQNENDLKMCLDVWEGEGGGDDKLVDLFQCNTGTGGGSNQFWSWQKSRTARTAHGATATTGQLVNAKTRTCLTARTYAPEAQGCTNVWGRPLADGGFALTLVNNFASAQNVTCDRACFQKLNISGTASFAATDLWAKTDAGPAEVLYTRDFSFTTEVDGDGASRMFRFSKA